MEIVWTEEDRNGPICSTDGTFFADCRAEERRILSKIDPSALAILDAEDAEIEREEQRLREAMELEEQQ